MRADELLQAHTAWWDDSVLLRQGELGIATAPLAGRAVTALLAQAAGQVRPDLTLRHDRPAHPAPAG
ncbi:hypothetical protein [Streptomyces sp. NPDC056069]|uniref:hypothetical protein n=1 Tax=Streptomyces sp. NPDC056069 TaxID=3345702 RepID=UPI0035DC7555